MNDDKEYAPNSWCEKHCYKGVYSTLKKLRERADETSGESKVSVNGRLADEREINCTYGLCLITKIFSDLKSNKISLPKSHPS